MNDIEKIQNELAQEYNYAPLPPEESKTYRNLFSLTIPIFLHMEGDNKPLYNRSNTLIANGYNRIVVGDYGAFIEFDEAQAVPENYIIKPGQEYRQSERYKDTVKYDWLTTSDYSDVKIYHQKLSVSYADYKPGYYYVGVYEVLTAEAQSNRFRSLM